MNRAEFLTLRNECIYQLHKRCRLKNMEIAKIEVQFLSDNFVLLRVKRGDRIFKVSLTNELTENMKLLCNGKNFNDYVFNALGDNKKHISHTMIAKIIKNYVEPVKQRENVRKDYYDYTYCFTKNTYVITKNGIHTDVFVDAKDIADQMINLLRGARPWLEAL